MRNLRLSVPGLATLALLAWLVYRPGLFGAFLFDDFANLPALGAYGPVTDWTTFWRYLTSGTADPTGRPLSLLSFLIDARDWPADPYPFKRTNLVIHIGNGLLLFVLLRQLGRLLGRPTQADVAALLGTAFWLLHPLMVSTTLYIVQREAMLPATFMLLGIAGYVHGRTLAAQGRIGGIVLAAYSVALGTILAFLSKANGALLPLLIWVLETTLLSRQPLAGRPARAFAWMRRLLVVLPSLLLLTYLAWVGWGNFVYGTPPHRPWTLGERLLTQCRIVTEYLAILWLPRPYTHGLFNDSITVSTGLFRPWTTFASLLTLAGLFFSAIAIRRRWPAWSAAILFFFVAHLMESSVVTLELYYEHRNYIPSLLMFWPLALWLTDLSPKATATSDPRHRLRGYKYALMLFLPLLLATFTWMRADLWGDVDDQAKMWALQNPDSPRAQAYAAQLDLTAGDPYTAIARLEPALDRRPDEIQVALNLVGAKCNAGTLIEADLLDAAFALRTTINIGHMGYRWFERSLAASGSPPCPQLNLTTIRMLLDAASENPHAMQVRGRRQDLLNLQARVALIEGNEKQALALFNAALDEDNRPEAALAHAALLASTGHPTEGLIHLDHFDKSGWSAPSTPFGNMKRVHQWLLGMQGYWNWETQQLRRVLEEEIAASIQD